MAQRSEGGEYSCILRSTDRHGLPMTSPPARRPSKAAILRLIRTVGVNLGPRFISISGSYIEGIELETIELLSVEH